VRDLREVPKKVLKEIKLVPVAHMDEVLRAALVLEDPEKFLAGPSVPVDWRVPLERRGNGERRDEARIPSASALPPLPPGAVDAPSREEPAPTPAPASAPMSVPLHPIAGRSAHTRH
jgi:hypothetical protein